MWLLRFCWVFITMLADLGVVRVLLQYVVAKVLCGFHHYAW